MNRMSNDDVLQRFETIWEHVECGIIIVDAETREILNINPVAARMFGDSKEKIIGNKCHKFICPANQNSCPIMDKGQVVDRSERIFVRADGQTLPIIKSVAKIQYNGRPALLESFTDISKLKETERQLMSLQVAEKASQAKSNFLSRMSHEMRTPLTAILGMAKIAEGTQDVDKLKRCLTTINASAQHLLGLVNDVLDMSKIEAGKLELDIGPVDVEAMLEKMIGLLTENAEEKGVTLRVSLSKELVSSRYMGDELHLSQVVANILSNAVKFTPRGGIIQLSAAEVECRPGWSVLRFSVADTGIGMTPEQSERLFQPFEQADTSISRQYGGTGLGLSISKSIVEKMNGRIWVESKQGEGSTFYFEVELEQPERLEVAGILNEETTGLLVLIADPVAEDAEGLAEMLRQPGNRVDTATDGKVAAQMLEAAREGELPYDAVLLAYPLLEEIRIGRTIEPLIVIGSFSEWSRHADEKNGVSRFLIKPLFPSAVKKAILESVRSSTGKTLTPPIMERLDLSGVTVLLAEDMEINREIFSALLEGTGISIVEAVNGAEAVALYQNAPEQFDMIIMDVQMPVMNGFEATQAIRGLDDVGMRDIPIIAMTANVFREDIERCLAAGMNDHLAKPIDEASVIDKILQYRKTS